MLSVLPQPKIDSFSKDRLQRRIAIVSPAHSEIADDRPLPDPRLRPGVVAGLAGVSALLTNKPPGPVAS
jgi:hypothetical protein